MAWWQRMRQSGLWLVIAGIGALVVFGGGFAGAAAYTSRPDYCLSCHEMSAEHTAWKGSPHAKVTCTDCHIEPGVTGLVMGKLQGLNQLRLHLTGAVPSNIKMDGSISDQVCLSCHQGKPAKAAVDGVKVVHKQHEDLTNLRCAECHYATAHAGIARRTEGHSQASPELLQQLTAADLKAFRTDKASCIGCHERQKVANRCEGCHVQIKTPENHREKSFATAHTAAPGEDLRTCIVCHGSTHGKPVAEKAAPGSMQAVRSTEFCISCHAQKPPSHEGDWAFGHVKAGRADQNGCFACHEASAPAGAKPTISACTQCHAVKS